ncbi:MAG TPA: fibronectin type III domain-containing protein [Thermoanaerobaculia bacterium]|nr:fibronectin type III domain-containing protein [Thermoanaerobaculia bacterium]
MSLIILSYILPQLAALATSAPSNLAATGVSSSQVNLTWTDNSSSETGFTFAFDTNSGLTSPTYTYAGGVNTTSYSHTGRNAATTYYYKIKAEGNPDSAWSTVDSATTAPANLAATATSNSAINLTWSGNGSNAAITGYTYGYAANSSFTGATYHYVAGNGSTSASRTGLGTATTYWFKLKAEGTSDALDSPYGTVVKATTTPAGLVASVVSSSQINLSWTGNSGNSNLIGYTIAYATNSSFSGAVYQYVAGAGATSYSNTGLYAGTTYYYKIKAEGTSDSYDSAFTAFISATTTAAAPNPPSGLTAVTASSSRIDLSWTDNSSDETGFEVKRATDSAFTQNVVWIGGIQGTTFSSTGLSAATTYYYKVRAQGATQSSAYSAAVSATTDPSGETIPNAPSGLAATAVSSTQVNLSWTDNSSNETGFEIKRATDSAFTQNVVWIGGIQGSTYANTGLSPATTYHYKVRAEGTAGKSAYSAAVSVATSGSSVSSGTPISPHFAGINAWMPYQIGPHVYNGKLESKWAEVQASGVQIMRYGGNGVDHYADPTWVETMDQYVVLADAMRSRGIEPVLQVPVYGDAFSASQAADIVRHVNIDNARAVKYWSIGNEPDLTSGVYQMTTAAQVASYFKPFASAMKAVDPSIKIIGPDTAWYHESIIDGLTSCDGSADDITGTDGNGNFYVDILSFHIYGFDGSQSTRSQVISKLTAAGGFNDDLGTLNARVAVCNSYYGRTGGNALKVAVTEANVDYENPAGDGVTGLGAKSFIGGQFWAELMGIAMQRGVDFVTFWSTIEGDELGYLSGDGSTKRPSYYHFQMMAQNFRGNSVAATDNSQPNVKTFGAQDVDQIAVMIMNQDSANGFDYSVRLDTGTVSGINPLKINIDAGVAVQYNGTISTESSIVLIFDASGAFKKKIEYKRSGHADLNLPPTVTP